MVDRVLQYAYRVRKQFFRYFVVGCSGLFIDMTLLILAKELLHVRPVLAVVASQAVALVYNFTLNRLWSFGGAGFCRSQLIKYGALVLFNYLFSVGCMYVFAEIYGIDYRIVRIGSIALMVCWNFFLYKYWVYAQTPITCESEVVEE